MSPSQLSGKSSSLYYGVIIQVNLCWPAPPVKIGAKFNCPHALADDDTPAVREISGENLVRENWSLLTSSLGLRQAIVATDLHGMEIIPTPQVLCPSLHVPILPISATVFHPHPIPCTSFALLSLSSPHIRTSIVVWADCLCFLNFTNFYFKAAVSVKSKVQIIHLSKAKQSVILLGM